MIEFRKITDIDSLMHWRCEVIGEVFGSHPDEHLLKANRDYYMHHISDGSHRAYVASVDGIDVGVGAICIYSELPSPDNRNGLCAYIMNVYVRKNYRRQGIASAIIGRLVKEAKACGCGKIYLETTSMARGLYHRCGFEMMENMMIYEK